MRLPTWSVIREGRIVTLRWEALANVKVHDGGGAVRLAGSSSIWTPNVPQTVDGFTGPPLHGDG
jgi:hypothetical protein